MVGHQGLALTENLRLNPPVLFQIHTGGICNTTWFHGIKDWLRPCTTSWLASKCSFTVSLCKITADVANLLMHAATVQLETAKIDLTKLI